MPLSIDIAFKWGKKKDEKKPPEEPKKEPPTKTKTGSDDVTETTTGGDTETENSVVETEEASLVAPAEAKPVDKLKPDPATPQKPVDPPAAAAPEKPKPAPPAAAPAPPPVAAAPPAAPKTGPTPGKPVVKTLPVKPAASDVESIGTDGDTTEGTEGDEDEEESSVASASTPGTPVRIKKNVVPKSPASTTKSKDEDMSMSDTTPKDDSKRARKGVQPFFNSSGAATDEMSASQASDKKEMSTDTTSPAPPKSKYAQPKMVGRGTNSLATPKSSNPRRIIILRHAERVDHVFPSWINEADKNGHYKPYNANQPRNLPKRRGGIKGFELDPPITETGKMTALLAAKSLKRRGVVVKTVFSSPALRCMQTAQIFLDEIKDPMVPIRIEPGLFDLFSFYESAPVFMTNQELQEAGFTFSKTYKPVLSRESLVKNFYNETKHDYYRRSHDVFQKILSSTMGTVLIIGHAPTIDSGTRTILDLPKAIPANHHIDRLHDRYPYCSSVILEQLRTSEWKLGMPLQYVSFLNQTSRLDIKFLIRKGVSVKE